MTGANHIAGGVVFTGIFASLWNVNVFSTVDLFAFTCIASLLPDIDHPKSILGKMFFPLARWLDRNWGHRTITHSLLFLFILTMASFYIEGIFHDTKEYSIVLFFAIFSHFILDMVTVQGIPLFYPFARNPCVIPGNPNLRIRSNNKSSELKAFAIFLIIGVSCVGLFQNGFWTSYNRAFGTLKHLHAENANSKNLILVDYDFSKNDVKYTGTAYVLNTTKSEAIIFDKKVITLSKGDNSTIIHSVKPLKSKFKKLSNEIGFFNISADSLMSFTKNKIITGQIQSSETVELIENNLSKKTNLFKLENSYDFQINYYQDSLRKDILNKIEMNRIKLSKNQKEYNKKLIEINKLHKELVNLKTQAKSENDLYLKNKYQNDIIDLKLEIEQKESSLDVYQADPLLTYQIKHLNDQLSQEDILFSGIISYPALPKFPPSELKEKLNFASIGVR